MIKARPLLIGIGVVLLCGVIASVLIPADSSPLLQPYDQQVGVPVPGDSFAGYVEDNEQHLRSVLRDLYFSQSPTPFTGDYTAEQVLQLRAPYEILPNQSLCGDNEARLGFLLVHGLTDSPYLLRSIASSLIQRYPCAIARGVLLPGHGTVPGDSLAIRHEDWITVTEFGVESFRGQVDSLFMVGYSMGTSLSLRYVDAHRDDDLISGLILLSPALSSSSGSAYLAQYLRWFSDWLGAPEAERDGAKYESFSVNAGAEFYQLTRNLTAQDFAPLNVPIFMAGSGDDTTVSMEAARAFFCAKAPQSNRHFIWYAAEATGSDPSMLCPGIEVVAAESPAHRVISLSHTSITLPPDDAHYGLNGAYRICLHYGAGTEDFETCVNDDAQTVYGERNLATQGRYEGKLVRRGSFNPHYDQMVEEIFRFVDGNR